MNQPMVCAVMLTAHRSEMAKRAMKCFKAQTYENKRMLVVNSGEGPLFKETHQIWEPCFIGIDALTIGALRNHAARYASTHYVASASRPEIFVHWDDDDVSHPNRITEQVALLQASGADCVGYNEMLFWREATQCTCEAGKYGQGHYAGCDVLTIGTDEAWLYSNPRPNYALGTSLCYWRKTWEAKLFEDIPRPGDKEGEDGRFIRGLKVASISAQRSVEISLLNDGNIGTLTAIAMMREHTEPRLIARIHSGNTSDQYRDIAQSGNWKGVPEWDSRVREIMS